MLGVKKRSGGTPNWELRKRSQTGKVSEKLPLVHVTAVGIAREIVHSGKLEARRCSVFNKGLLYFFAVRAAYRLKEGDAKSHQINGFPFVFIGRRESPAGAISYVGADYVSSTRAVYDWVWKLGHRKIALVSVAEEFEPTLDRRDGYRLAAGRRRRKPIMIIGDDPAAALLEALAQQVTALLVESTAMAEGIKALAEAGGIAVPGGLSIAVLGDSDPTQQPSSTRAASRSDTDWSMFRIPRRQMGADAIRTLTELLAGSGERQTLLPCELHRGATVSAPQV